MTHHVMTQMGHGIPNMIGIDADGLDEKIRPLLPGYMGDMGAMQMGVPKNSLPMVGGEGPFGYITMGGMFTIFKVRDGITTYEDPGWYQHPAGTLATLASEQELRADGVDAPAPTTAPATAIYTCPMHPEVRSNEPGKCPKCGMNLVLDQRSE